MYGIMWFREDLRIHDNKALSTAARQFPNGIIGIYFIDPELWRKNDFAACRIEFQLRGLDKLKQELEYLNIPLLVVAVSATRLIPEKLFEMMCQLKADTLFFNRQYEFNEYQRDQAVIDLLNKNNSACYGFDDQTILLPNTVLTQQGSFYKIFTPYQKAWQKVFNEHERIHLLPAPKAQAPIKLISSVIPRNIDGFTAEIDSNLWEAGEKVAQQKLKSFITKKLFTYDKQRDFPACEGTSQLSPYLAAGMISARQCFYAALKANNGDLNSGNKGAVTWMNELIWREFYKHLVVAVPRISRGKAYQLSTERLPWNYDKKLFSAWAQGKTGIPIVDAAMRQLNTIGWMHNRLRMIVAMFLTKNLFIDWRLGEKYFMNHLIDGDFSANNGGWQWSASTGVDAAPYFRVFNPVLQSERFDPQGQFIRQYCPELSSLDNKKIHDPTGRACERLKELNYPPAIVDLNKSRIDFISKFKKLHKI